MEIENDLLKVLIIFSYVTGIICAAMAILRSRTPQGATAWVMSLLSFPFISVPAFLCLGRNKFEGYNTKRRILDSKVQNEFQELNALKDEDFHLTDEMTIICKTIATTNQPGFTKKNKVKLLINSEEAFPEMLEAIDKAKEYIIFQFYLVRPDETGMTFLNALIKKAKEGVKVTFMNDAIGVMIPRPVLKAMEEAGVEIGTFNESTKKGKLQINFRNHRKIVVVDGEVAFLGGLNIGDEYAGLKEKYGAWRDTNVKIEGPSVIAAQLSCAKDWYFIHQKPIRANWDIKRTHGHSSVMVLHTGPADDKHACLLSYISLINSATKRLWIANAYYVPPESLMNAILLASLRGVDVRVLIPGYSDAKFVMLASKVYQKLLLKHGVKVYRYNRGFLHQKVMLVDDSFTVVGSANFDCRSMFINFEVSMITTDRKFNKECAKMLVDDFMVSTEIHLSEFENYTLLQKIATRGANLLAPVL
jgi:cardiolipin synthase A/B